MIKEDAGVGGEGVYILHGMPEDITFAEVIIGQSNKFCYNLGVTKLSINRDGLQATEEVKKEEVMVIKQFSKIGTWIVLMTYLLLLVIGISKGTLTIRTGVLTTVASALTVSILYWFPKLFAFLNRKLYEELRRMMK